MTAFISNLIGNNYIATLVMSIIPLIELKGGIIFARGAGLSFFVALGLAYLGSTIIVIPLFFLLRPILNWLKKFKGIGKFAEKVEKYFKGRAEKAVKEKAKEGENTEKKEKFMKMLGVFLFVAIPLPLTGVWTGTAIAVFLDMKFKDAILPIAVGNLVAGLIISVLAEILLAFLPFATAKTVLDGILYGLFGLAVILLIITIIRMSKQKVNKEQDEKAEEGENK